MAVNSDLELGTTTNGTSSVVDKSLGQGVVVETTQALYLSPGNTSGISLISFQLVPLPGSI
ncbi:hypothetical protein HAX54_018454, partial [Datura stramonium]|nr:hypothetical protein [Datura stramonium]